MDVYAASIGRDIAADRTTPSRTQIKRELETPLLNSLLKHL